MPPKRQRSAGATPPRAEKKSKPGLEGLRIVLTGETTIVPRSVLQSQLKEAGANVTSAVSGVTNILIYGPKLEDGRPYTFGSKYQKAMELLRTQKSKSGITVMSEEEFYEKYPQMAPQAATSVKDADAKAVPANPKAELWAEKWRPIQEADFAFNQSSYYALKQWLSSWIKGEVPGERGCLLTGPPGVGKTSSVHSVCRALDCSLLEFNASDTRSKKKLQTLQALIWGGSTLGSMGLQKRTCLLMDEADGLSAGDRGGSEELSKMIQKTAIPIIATCNDKQHPKVKSLSKYCRVIPFNPLDKTAAKQRCKAILEQEGRQVGDSVIEDCFDASNGDMRHLLNTLQATVEANNTQNKMSTMSRKDVVAYLDAFGMARQLLAPNGSLRDRLDVYFFDPDMMPLIVQENLIKSWTRNNDEKQAVSRAARICDAVAFGDCINKRLRERNQWELMPDVGTFAVVLPSLCVKLGAFVRMDFPQILGKISSRNKKKRQLGELASCTGHANGIADGFYELLGEWVFQPLTGGEPDESEFDDFFARADAYGLATRELVVENLVETRHKDAPMLYEKLATKHKTKLTKLFKERTTVHSSKKSKVKLVSDATPAVADDDEEDAEVDIAEEDVLLY